MTNTLAFALALALAVALALEPASALIHILLPAPANCLQRQ